jgi:hypothetical protein
MKTSRVSLLSYPVRYDVLTASHLSDWDDLPAA